MCYLPAGGRFRLWKLHLEECDMEPCQLTDLVIPRTDSVRPKDYLGFTQGVMPFNVPPDNLGGERQEQSHRAMRYRSCTA